MSFAALREWAYPRRRVWGTVSLAFATLFTGLTSAVHFVKLTAVRQVGGGGITWPSSAYALERLAWDWFLGLALLAAAPVFRTDMRGDRPAAERRLRRGFLLAGALCLAGVVGPLTGDMRLQRIGIVGYAVALPVVFHWLARHLRRVPSGEDASARADVGARVTDEVPPARDVRA